jgi:hypothetical protein
MELLMTQQRAVDLLERTSETLTDIITTLSAGDLRGRLLTVASEIDNYLIEDSDADEEELDLGRVDLSDEEIWEDLGEDSQMSPQCSLARSRRANRRRRKRPKLFV